MQVPTEPVEEEVKLQSEVHRSQQKPGQQARQGRGKGRTAKTAQAPEKDRRKGKKRKSTS